MLTKTIDLVAQICIGDAMLVRISDCILYRSSLIQYYCVDIDISLLDCLRKEMEDYCSISLALDVWVNMWRPHFCDNLYLHVYDCFTN